MAMDFGGIVSRKNFSLHIFRLCIGFILVSLTSFVGISHADKAEQSYFLALKKFKEKALQDAEKLFQTTLTLLKKKKKRY